MSIAQYNADQWQEIQERKPGVKILVKLSGVAEIAYFKYKANEAFGPVNGNEYIAYCLSQKIGLPVPRTEFLIFGDKKGTVSFAVPGEANLWSVYPNKNALDYSLDKFELLPLLIAFDFWIMNIDRHQDNLMYSKIPGDSKYHFFAIDHGHSLYGPSKAPPPNFTDFPFDTIVKMQEFKDLFKKGFAFFEQEINKILAVPDNEIVEIVNSVPVDFMGDGEKRIVIDLLVQRQKLLKDKISNFCVS